MSFRRITSAAVGGLLALGLLAGTGIVSAHGVGRAAGTLGTVGTSSVQVTVNGTTKSVAVTPSTRVIKQVAGSLSDLTPGTRVSLHINGTTVDAVRILGAWAGGTKAQHPKSGRAPKTGTAPTGSKPVHTGTHPGAGTRAGGQVVSLTGNQLVLTTFRNGNTTYTLASNVSVTKFQPGTLSDLHSGEKVQVRLSRSGAAAVIVILS